MKTGPEGPVLLVDAYSAVSAAALSAVAIVVRDKNALCCRAFLAPQAVAVVVDRGVNLALQAVTAMAAHEGYIRGPQAAGTEFLNRRLSNASLAEILRILAENAVNTLLKGSPQNSEKIVR
jgi:riboflavin biosynthesis pyrimidine reductase